MFGFFKRKTKENIELGKELVNIEEIKQTKNNIVSLGKRYLSPSQAIKEAKTESFSQAIKRLDVTEQDLIKRYISFAWSFYISLLFALFCFAGFIYFSFFEQQIMPSLSMLSILMVCLANAFKYSFRAFQIKTKTLCSAKVWWDSPNDWFPSVNNTLKEK